MNTDTHQYSTTMGTRHERIVILGSGPAGLAAALYAARAELKPVVLTGIQPGGQAALTHRIENYPGFPDGVGGIELGELFQKQAERFGAIIEFNSAQGVDFTSQPLVVMTDNGPISSDVLIICTGATPKYLNIPGEKELTGRGVSYCGTCDGWFFKDKRILVVGGGDSALEESLFLTRFATSVTIVHRRENLRAGALLQNRASENKKIQFIMNTIVTEVIGTDRLESVKLLNVVSKEERVIPTEGLFVFIGHSPNSQIFRDLLDMENGFIKINKRMQTNIRGVFAAGEVADPFYKQVVTSAGMGSAAAIEAIRFLEEQDNIKK